MAEIHREQLYQLIPSIYRIRDQAQGEPLRALMAALESELRVVEEDIDALYDNWFIETCDEWTIPYLASLVGSYNQPQMSRLFPTQRRQVANTLGYRRRKGLPAVLEHALADVTGWHVHVLEYDRLLAGTQHLRGDSRQQSRLADLHQSTELHGPFEATAHTIDLHTPGTGPATLATNEFAPGKYRPGNLGLFFWRLQSYPLRLVTPRAVTRMEQQTLPPGCFTFDPLGRDLPLFNLPQAVEALTQSVTPANLPLPLTHKALADDLEEYRTQQDTQSGENVFEEEDLFHNSTYYGPDRALCVLLNGAPLLPDTVLSADLSQWQLPPAGKRRQESLVAIDVALGRLRLLATPPHTTETALTVNYCYAFSTDLGGGPYVRSLPAASGPRYRINVLQGGKISTLHQAFSAWDEYCQTWKMQHQATDALQDERPRGTIHIVDNGHYAENELRINLPRNADLIIEATDGMRPVIEGLLLVRSEHGGTQLQLHGLLLHNRLVIDGGLSLTIGHCTLLPAGLETLAATRPAYITIDHSLVGQVQLHNPLGTLNIQDSVVDHAAGLAIAALHPENQLGPRLNLQRTTIFGRVRAYELDQAVDVLFTARVTITEQQKGLVSYSYVPPNSQTPAREHCLPSEDPPEHPSTSPEQQDQANQAPTQDQAYPLFTSTRYGDAAYAQLATHGSPRLRRAASNGSEIGVFNHLYQAQRQENISQTLDEYLPFGLTTEIFYAT